MVKLIATEQEFDSVITGTSKLVVVDFTASWCGPCKHIAPIFAQMADEFKDVVFVKVDVDENEDTARKCNINCMPTFKFFKDGQEIDSMEGADEGGLKAMIIKYK